jgi:hypothetical protein
MDWERDFDVAGLSSQFGLYQQPVMLERLDFLVSIVQSMGRMPVLQPV